MDKTGLRELLSAGLGICKEAWDDPAKAEGEGLVDSRTATTLDRITQVGLLALEHENEWLWQESVTTLHAAYRLAVPGQWRTWQPEPRAARWLLAVVYRAYVLGAAGVIRERFALLPSLTLRQVHDEYQDYWLRYAVTMVSRAKIPGAFHGKSLLPPISEYVRERKAFSRVFGDNQDRVVNALCQYDFLACVSAIAEAKDVDRAYPNFGGFYSDRTMPVVQQLIRRGPARKAVPDVEESLLAEILRELDKVARKWFFDVAGWEGYDEGVYGYIKQFAPPAE